MRIFILIFVAYFFFFEIVGMLREGLAYWTDIFNWIDNISFMVNLYLIYATVYDTHSADG